MQQKRMRLTICFPPHAKIAQSGRIAQRVYRCMGIIVLFLLAAGALGCVGTALHVLLRGPWWHSGLLCLALLVLLCPAENWHSRCGRWFSSLLKRTRASPLVGNPDVPFDGACRRNNRAGHDGRN
jgi:hypothetical protein